MSHSPHIGRFDDLTGPFVYARAHAIRGYPVLAQSDIARLLTTELVRTLGRFGSEAVAYCILPERAHVLAAGVERGADPGAGVRRWKQVTGFARYVRSGRRLWSERSLVVELPDLTTLEAAAGYVVAAPVGAGLVGRADRYRWVGATRWTIADLSKRFAAAPGWRPERVTSESRTGCSLPR